MDTRALRDLAVLLPGEDPDDLDQLDGPPCEGSALAERLVTGDAWTRAQLVKMNISRSWFVNADLASCRFDSVTLDRCVLNGCTLVGAQWNDVTLKNVVFENCRIDYATFTDIRTVASVALIGCSLTEATFTRCKLGVAAFDGCRLTATSFEASDLRGADLRGNDLSSVTGIESLRGAIVSDDQLPGLIEAVVSDLDLSVR